MPVLLLLTVPVAIAGCVDGAVPSASPKPAPVFGSDDDAVAAARSAYERYLVINAAINADRGQDPERILEVTTNSYGTQLLADYREMREAGISITGEALLDSSQLIEIDSGRQRIVVGVCLDLSHTRVFNRAGTDVTPDGNDVSALVVSFEAVDQYRVLLDGSELWSDESAC